MAIRIACADCGYSAWVKTHLQGKRVRCPKCQSPVVVPDIEADDTAASESPAVAAPRQQPQVSVERQSTAGANRFLLGALSSVVLLLLLGIAYYLGTQSGQSPQPTGDPLMTTEAAAPHSPPSNHAEVPAVTGTSAVEQPAAETPAARPQPAVAEMPQPKGASTAIDTAAAPSPGRPEPAITPPKVVPDALPDRPRKESVEFALLPLEEPVTSMAMTEDQRYLVLSHQAAGQVTFYDVDTGQSAVAYTSSPRSILCRQGQVFVANFGEGTISVFSGAPDWKLTNLVEVIKPNIVHLSAPQGRAFDGRLIVTCHGEGNQASYRDSHIYEVDIKADRCEPVSRAALASVSHDGRLILTQGSFNLSPSGGISAYSYDEYVAGGAEPIFRGGNQQTPFVYQPWSGSYWISQNVVFGGVPLAQVGEDVGPLIVPDLSQKVLYSLTKDRVVARKLVAGLPEVGWKRVAYPKPFTEDFSRLHHFLYRRRGYLLDHPIAITRGDELTFYVLAAKGGAVLQATTTAFDATAVETPVELQEPLTHRPDAGGASAPPTPGESAELFAGLPKMVAVGQQLEFPVTLEPGTTLELMAALPGMSLTDENELRWTPTQAQIGVHKLKVRIQQAGAVTFERPSIEVIPAELADSVDGDLSRLADAETLPLSIDRYTLETSADGQSLLLLQGDVLQRLSRDGTSVIEEVTLPNRYQLLGEREDVYVAVAKSPKPVLDLIDRQTLQVSRSIDLTTAGSRVLEITDLAVHPVAETSYVAIKQGIELPRYFVLVVDEPRSQVAAPPILGKWVEVSPDGQTLLTGYSDIYRQGTHFHINPDWRLIETPDYGSVDMLLAWDLGNQFALKGVVREAGGNGGGIRVSADGRRVTYLSHVGTPRFSKNLVGFDPQELSAAGVTYETSERGVTSELAYHPFLPLVAVPGGTGAVLFHRETGKLLENRLLLTADGLGETKVERLLFAPDGKHLIVVCMGGETGRYLRSVPLKLTPADRRERLTIPEAAAPQKPAGRGTRV